MHAIETQLQELTKVKPKPKEPRQEYLARLAEAVGDDAIISDTAFDKLPEDVQKWANAATKAVKAERPVTDFPGEETKADKKDDKTPAKKPSKPVKEAAVDKKPAKADKPEKANGAAKVAKTLPEDGVKFRIKQAIIDKPDIGVEDLEKMLAKKGAKPSRFTVAAIRADFRHSLRVLKQAGWPKVQL